METLRLGFAPGFASRAEFLKHNLVRIQVKFPNFKVAGKVFLQVADQAPIRMFSADKSDLTFFVADFHTQKSDEKITCYYQTEDGTVVYDKPQKRSVKCATGKNVTFSWHEWVWGWEASTLRHVMEEPRATFSETSTAIICWTRDPEDWRAPEATAETGPKGSGSSTASSNAASANNSATNSAEASPALGRHSTSAGGVNLEGIGSGRGRGLARKDTASVGRGRGSGSGGEGSPSSLAQRKRGGGGSGSGSAIVDASLTKFVELMQLHPRDAHFIVCTGGPRFPVVEPVSELLRKRLVTRAHERTIALDPIRSVVEEPLANHEFYTFYHLRLILNRCGVSKCVLVARDVDLERLLQLWTALMAGLKISISTCPVATKEEDLEMRTKEAAALAEEAQREIQAVSK